MFKKRGRTRKKNNKMVDTFIGKGTSMEGILETEGIIHIEGYFKGEIKTKSEVMIGADAKVRADITSTNVTLSGNLIGNVTTSEKLLIHSSGVLNGDIKVGALAVEEGAFFAGNCTMEQGKEEKNKNLLQQPEIKEESLEGSIEEGSKV